MQYLQITPRKTQKMAKIFKAAFNKEFSAKSFNTNSDFSLDVDVIASRLVTDLKIIEVPYKDFTIHKKIVAESARLLAIKRVQNSKEDLANLWAEVLQDYFAKDGWGLKNQTLNVWPFVWAVFQSWFLVKVGLLVFGMPETEELTLVNKIGVITCVLITTVSLITLAVRNYTKFEDYEAQRARESAAEPPKSSFDENP